MSVLDKSLNLRLVSLISQNKILVAPAWKEIAMGLKGLKVALCTLSWEAETLMVVIPIGSPA